MTRFDLVFAGIVATALVSGCATTSTPAAAPPDRQANDNVGGGAAGSIKRTISDPNAIKDMVRQPGLQVGRGM